MRARDGQQAGECRCAAGRRRRCGRLRRLRERRLVHGRAAWRAFLQKRTATLLAQHVPNTSGQM